ncbi:MAG: hypothetical protein J6R28_04740, partial [Bacteroides sp.]|nr:hypothetical protein [Bacteroides sp.]
MTSCNEVEDLYNPELVREKAKQALGLDIAPDQDWNMTSVVTANITLNEDALSDYSFRIYSANPISDANAVVLANVPVKTDVQGKASASFKFEMPSYLKSVYVARVDSHGRRWMGISSVQNGVISKDFGESSATRSVTDYALPTMENPYTKEQVNSLLVNAYDIANGLNHDGYKSILQKAGTSIGKITGYYNQNITLDVANGYIDENGQTGYQVTDEYNNTYWQNNRAEIGQFKLIIADGATWEIAEGTYITGIDIIVAKGGTLKFTNRLNTSIGTRIIVMKGGTIDATDSSMI